MLENNREMSVQVSCLKSGMKEWKEIGLKDR